MRIVIVGAGIAGLALASHLADTGAEVVVLERAPRPREQGYMIDFFGPGYDAAEAMGLLPRLAELGYEVDEVAYVDHRGRRRAGLNYARFARTVGGRLLSIMRPSLELALREHLDDRVDLRFGCGVEEVRSDARGVGVRLADGSEVDGDVLVGTDGVHSAVREQVFGPQERYLRHLGFHTAAWTFRDPHSHAVLGKRFCLTDTVGRLMGCYALRDGSVAVFTLHRTAEQTLPDDVRAAVRREYAGLGWITARALERCPDDAAIYYDQVAQIEMRRWTRGRVALLGDSCQSVSLLAGQGASLAMGAARVLGRELAEVTRPDELEAAFARYERRWRPVVAEKQRVGRGAAGWFLPPSRPRLWVRRAAMNLAGLPGMDRLLGNTLAGKAVPVPE